MIRLLATILVVLLGVVAYVELNRDPDPAAAKERPDEDKGQQDPAPHIPLENVGNEVETLDLPVLSASSLSEGLFEKGQWRGKPVLFDLDGDKKLDLVASIRRWDSSTAGEGIHVWMGNGAGKWTPANEGLRRDMGYGGSAIGDVDGDGRPDVAFSGHAGTPSVFLNLLNEGTWVPIQEGIDVTVICGDVGLGDFDGDGKVDLAAIGQFPKDSGLFVYRGDGTGTFARVANLIGKTNYGGQVHFVDLDGDGLDELIAVSDLGPKVWRFENEKFVDISEGLPKPAIGGMDLAIAATDLIGDGHKELIRAGIQWDGHPSLQTFRWNGKSWESFGKGLPNAKAYFDVAVAKLGDKTAILAAAQSGIHVVVVNGQGEFEALGRIDNTEGTLNVCAGDIDADGVDEVVYCGFNGVRVLQLSRD